MKLETDLTSNGNKNHRSITHEEEDDEIGGLSIQKKKSLLRENNRGAQTQADDLVLCDVNPIDRFKIIKTFQTNEVEAPTLRQKSMGDDLDKMITPYMQQGRNYEAFKSGKSEKA